MSTRRALKKFFAKRKGMDIDDLSKLVGPNTLALAKKYLTPDEIAKVVEPNNNYSDDDSDDYVTESDDVSLADAQTQSEREPQKETETQTDKQKQLLSTKHVVSDSLIRMDFRSNVILNGVTSSGKSTFIKNIFSEKYWSFTQRPDTVYLFAKVANQNLYKVVENDLTKLGIGFEVYDDVFKLPDVLKTVRAKSVVLIDDFMVEAVSNKKLMSLLTDLFNVHTHHKNLITIVTLHNLFADGFRTIRLNTNFIFLFSNPIDTSSINRFFSQVEPGDKATALFEAYKYTLTKITDFNNRFFGIEASRSSLNKRYFAGFEIEVKLLTKDELSKFRNEYVEIDADSFNFG